jgi:hypothetical protein
MAQWEARDPRWLVEERPDGRNPNKWHWEERSIMAWSREDLGARLLVVSAALPDGGGTARVTKVASVEGEVRISFCFFVSVVFLPLPSSLSHPPPLPLFRP